MPGGAPPVGAAAAPGAAGATPGMFAQAAGGVTGPAPGDIVARAGSDLGAAVSHAVGELGAQAQAAFGPAPTGEAAPAADQAGRALAALPGAAAVGVSAGKERNAFVWLVLSYVCGLPFLYLLWQLPSELDSIRKKNDINPILFLVPIINILQVWKVGEKVLETKQMLGMPNPQVISPIVYLLFFPYAMITDMNDIYAHSGPRPGQPVGSAPGAPPALGGPPAAPPGGGPPPFTGRPGAGVPGPGMPPGTPFMPPGGPGMPPPGGPGMPPGGPGMPPGGPGMPPGGPGMPPGGPGMPT
jgi:hypothetical protein